MDHDVSRLDISVNDALGIEVLEALAYLSDEGGGLSLKESMLWSLSKKLLQVPAIAVLQNDVNVFGCLHTAVHLHDMLMF